MEVYVCGGRIVSFFFFWGGGGVGVLAGFQLTRRGRALTV